MLVANLLPDCTGRKRKDGGEFTFSDPLASSIGLSRQSLAEKIS